MLCRMSGSWIYDTTVVGVEPLGELCLRVRFRDGTEGIADLGDLAGKGVFKQWDHPDVWGSVRIEADTLAWGSSDPTERLDISRGSLYIRVAGLTWDDLSSASFALSSAKRLSVSA